MRSSQVFRPLPSGFQGLYGARRAATGKRKEGSRAGEEVVHGSEARLVRKNAAAFTLAEVLAALMFMAIVIPVAIQGLRIANAAGVVAERRAVAARIANRMLNELMVMGTWQQNNQHGTVWDDSLEYRWSLEERNWEPGTLELLTLEVRFDVQGREMLVQLSTLADASAGLTTSTNQASTSASTSGGTSR